MRVDLFDFELPEDLIALRPVRPRDAARLMVVKPGEDFAHRHVRDLPELLDPGDVLVVNDTKVIPAVLRGKRQRHGNTAAITLTLFERIGPDIWRAFAKPAKRLAAGDIIDIDGSDVALEAEVAEDPTEGIVTLRFSAAGPELDRAIAVLGHVPLPSYIASRRADDNADRVDYQTVYAEREGAIAAPTAGLHFTPDLLERLAERGVGLVTVTLHVGPGTFIPVKTDTVEAHKMHSEWGEISDVAAATINNARRYGKKIISVGTTSLRLLESAVDKSGEVQAFSGETDIFITPGYRFKAVDALLTNFHLPRSTLFMLVSAFSGRERMLGAYREAIERGYRFYSYGDASLLYPEAA